MPYLSGVEVGSVLGMGCMYSFIYPFPKSLSVLFSLWWDIMLEGWDGII